MILECSVGIGLFFKPCDVKHVSCFHSSKRVSFAVQKSTGKCSQFIKSSRWRGKHNNNWLSTLWKNL